MVTSVAGILTSRKVLLSSPPRPPVPSASCGAREPARCCVIATLSSFAEPGIAIYFKHLRRLAKRDIEATRELVDRIVVLNPELQDHPLVRELHSSDS